MARFRRPDLSGGFSPRPGLPPPPRNLILGCRLAMIGSTFGTLLGFYFFLSSFGGGSFGELTRTEVRSAGIVAMVESITALALAVYVSRGSFLAAKVLTIVGLIAIGLSGFSINLVSLVGVIWIGASTYLIWTGAREWHTGR
jgi:hypothetical protein